ncbi:hypothetical protein ILUMI_04210 [Ignelater luminosus]|uniref:Uncharacterized protein n=1 Tax=Ignelater luminosus TaxID=2038154 RepID=A0A8K0DA43_IGNLU|nr:hypothetical protein ILUMI_04210 [Ignelater luminosus]
MKLRAVLLVFFVNLGQWIQIFVHCKIIELCDPETLYKLQPLGINSSVTINLNPKDHRRVCRLNITAPNSHVVNLQWKDHRELLDSHSSDTSPCPLSIFLPENQHTPIWKGDPCTNNGLPEVDLLTPQFRLIWTPPRFGFHARGRKLVITAVGQGDICQEEGQHICMRIGWKPALCVSEQLICDGKPNCPKGAPTSDEDEELCKNRLLSQTSWQQLAEEVIKNIPPGLINSRRRQNKVKDNTVTENPNLPYFSRKYENRITSTSQPEHHHHDSGDSVSAALAHYGPWGYLMLGMLICGTVLMFCGLWECCFRKPKPQIELQNQQQPTTVLIINRQQDDVISHQPPNYDDLDQPPSYMTLFPNFKLEITESNEDNVEESENNANDANTSDEHDELEQESVTISDVDSSSSREVEDVRERRSPVVCIVTSV